MLNLAFSFLIAFLGTLGIVHYAHLHEKFSTDHDLDGVQKFHVRPVPRVGGVGIVLGALGAALLLLFRYPWFAGQTLILLACAAPAFGAGFVEDVTKRVSPRARLFWTMVAALLASVVMGIRIERVDIPALDPLFAFVPLSIAFTVVAVAALANAINIIDGFNGLASMVATLMFISMAYVAFKLGDALVLTIAFIMIGAILGFFAWNYPFGLIFLGDGGAYFIGFMLAELAILLVVRHPEVSAWYPVLMFIYPIFEVIFSIYRRRFIKGSPPDQPDSHHLHTLIYKRVMRWAVGSRNAAALTRRNSFTSPYLWMLCLAAVLPATLFWRYTWVLVGCVCLFVLFYVWLYTCIVKFRTPRWLIFRRHAQPRHRKS
ncbi:glycosyltransferase [Pandoraea sp.]|uniref:MraY family glycosyltransferase n=1 Tax=Pandoraea sp. TaxID=1883445 RepID=UPI0011FF9606|nr:glycosyltransferase [Pandoraea sp.]TAL55382.1 MAG: glycosyl transferase [Pandoraea sp.]TAM15710.1 MAG: glycosyl transferase [Pandoraea sp.]